MSDAAQDEVHKKHGKALKMVFAAGMCYTCAVSAVTSLQGHTYYCHS
jgi:hypothetical protein